jgi:hypothetical protein
MISSLLKLVRSEARRRTISAFSTCAEGQMSTMIAMTVEAKIKVMLDHAPGSSGGRKLLG